MDKAYEQVDVAMKPLGLSMSERPKVGIKPRYATSPGWQTSVTGALVLEGKRHGRSVSVVNEGGSSEVTVRPLAGVQDEGARRPDPPQGRPRRDP